MEGKPKEMREDFRGQTTHFAKKILLEQPFIKNPDQTVRNRENAIRSLAKIEVSRFVRYAAGNRS